MNLKLFFIVFCLLTFGIFAQTGNKAKPVQNTANTAKSSAAYAEVLLRKTELSAQLESLLLDYTEDFPKVKELRYEIGLLEKDLEKILTVSDASKLSAALGRLFVRRAELQVDLWLLQKQYADEHPEVKRAKKRVEIFNQAIKEILP